MEDLDQSTQQIKDLLRERVFNLKWEMELLQKELVKAETALLQFETPIGKETLPPAELKKLKKAEKKANNVPMDEKMRFTLAQAGRPLTTHEFFEAINKNFPEHPILQMNWSPKLAEKTMNPKNKMQRIKLKGVHSSFYGLKKWFFGKKLKQSYLKEILKAHPDVKF